MYVFGTRSPPSHRFTIATSTTPAGLLSSRVIVCHKEHPVACVWSTNGARGYNRPLRVIPEVGQVSNHVPHCPSSVGNKEPCDVLHEQESGS